MTAKVWTATEMEDAKPMDWLAKGFLPSASVSILVGDEGIGKSLYWVKIAAAVTTGKPMHECGIPARDPQVVTLIITEDDWAATVRPRLVAAGADLDMIRVICASPDGGGAPEFPDDMYLVYETEPALVVVDTLMDVVGTIVGSNARKILHPWKELATRTGAAVLLMAHTNRSNAKSARDRYGTTGEFRKKARMTLFAQRDDDGYLTVGPEKTNITKPVDAVRFGISPVQMFEPTDDHDGTVPVLEYVGSAGRTAAEILAATSDGDERQERKDAVMWLQGYLELHGTVLSMNAKEAAKKVGIATRTLQRARKQLNVVIGYVGQPPVSTWRLP